MTHLKLCITKLKGGENTKNETEDETINLRGYEENVRNIEERQEEKEESESKGEEIMFKNRKLKKLVNKMCGAVDKFASAAGLPDDTGEIARMDMGMFMMYLSASDGKIEQAEADLIADICNLKLSPDAIEDIIIEKNIYSSRFGREVPLTFQIMVKADTIMRAQGIDASGSELMLTTYKAIGEALIKSDGDVGYSEMTDYELYIEMMEKYRNNNLNV